MQGRNAVIFGEPKLYGRKRYVYPVSYTDPITGTRKHKKFYTDETDYQIVLSKKEEYRLQFVGELSSAEVIKSPLIPLSTFLEEYFVDHEKILKESTTKDYRRYAQRFVTYLSSDVSLQYITESVCIKFLNQISTPYAREGARKALRSIFNYAKATKNLSSNPFEGIKRFPLPVRNRDYFNDKRQDFQKFFEQLPETSYKERTFKYACLLANETGQRSGTIRNLRINDVDFEAKTWQIRITSNWSPKGNKEHIVDLTEDAILSIKNQLTNKMNMEKERIRNSEYLFCNNAGNPYEASRFSNLFCKYKKLFLPERSTLKFHSFRHSVGQNMYNAGVDLQSIAKLLGHAGQDITQKFYAKLADMHLTPKAMTVLAARPSIQNNSQSEISSYNNNNDSIQTLLELLKRKDIITFLETAHALQN